MKKTKQLANLAKLTEMAFAARSVEFSGLLRAQDKLAEQYRDIEKQREEALGLTTDGLGHRVTGADVLYQVWVGQQLTRINAELAQAIVKKERCRDLLARDFGKQEVSKKIFRSQKDVRRPAGQDW